MSKKHSIWKDNVIVYCHLLTRNLASFSVRQVIDGQTRQWRSFPCFSLVDAFKLSALYVHRTTSTQATAQKVDIMYRLKNRSNTAHWTVLTPTTVSIWTMETPSKMTRLTPCVKSFTGGTIASKAVSSLKTKNMRHFRHTPTKNTQICLNCIIPT